MAGFVKYKSYSFTEKDPIIDVLRTIKKDSGMSDGEIADNSGVSAGTLRNWFVGNTRRPQFATVAAAAQAMGADSLPLTSAGRQKLKGK